MNMHMHKFAKKIWRLYQRSIGRKPTVKPSVSPARLDIWRNQISFKDSIDRRIQLSRFIREALINSADEMKHEAHGTQQPRPINKIGEGASTVQRSDSLV